jgi:rhodanese-related sulfurtransferase
MLGGDSAWGIERFDIIKTEQLHEMLVRRKAGEIDFLLVNTLDEIIYRDQFIPGSINIPLDKVAERLDELGNDKNRLIITYCMGYR